jgi:pyruvate carboxylase
LPARRKAEDGNESHIAPPMPGAVTTIAIKPGLQVKAGDLLLTLEVMKMETSLSAPRDGKIAIMAQTPQENGRAAR